MIEEVSINDLTWGESDGRVWAGYDECSAYVSTWGESNKGVLGLGMMSVPPMSRLGVSP
jgi:hypothetical protein